MNKKFIYLLTFIIISTSLYAKPKGRKKGFDKKFVSQYCDLKKNLKVAIVKVNDKAVITHNEISLRKGYYEYLGKNIFVSIGDAALASGRCDIGEVATGKEVSDKDLECILNNLNRKNKNFGIITTPGESEWQRGSEQSLDDIERLNKKLKNSGEKTAEYRKFLNPETRTLFEDLVYAQIENSFTSSSQFTVVDRAAMDAIVAELRKQHSGAFDESNQKELGKMAGADLIAVADIISYGESTKKKSGLGGSKRYSIAQIEVIIKLLNVETGVIFGESIQVWQKSEIKGSGKANKARAKCLAEFSVKLMFELDASMSDFPFERSVNISKRGSITIKAGLVDGVQNDMIFNLFILDYDEDEDEYYEDEIGQIIVVDNEKGRGVEAGTKSKCDPIDFNESLDRDYNYLVRIPKDIKSKMKCE